MKNKMFILLVFIILLIFSANVYAEDEDFNSTLTASIEIEEGMCQDFDEKILPSIDSDEKLLVEDSEIIIDDSNYNQYFNKYTGKFNSNIDATKIKTIKMGNVSNALFTFENPINIIPLTSNSQITNGVIHLIEGSDGSNITGITIINNDSIGDIKHDGILVSRAHGIWFSSSNNNLIYNNTIIIGFQKGCYAMPMGYSNNNRILNNKIISGLTSCILMGDCDDTNISYNYIEILGEEVFTTSNLIYFNHWGHVDYSGSGACKNVYISNNYLKNFGTTEWAINMAVGETETTNLQIINNILENGCIGIYASDSLYHSQPKNVLIKNNTVINCLNAIVSGSNNVTIEDNIIQGSSLDYGIVIMGYDLINYNHKVLIYNNLINSTDFYSAIDIHSDNVTVFNNNIYISRYGMGVRLSPIPLPKPASADNCLIENNNINICGDEGISIYSHNTTVIGNIISTKSIGVKITSYNDRKIYNNSIIENIIFSDDYGVYIEGTVFNTTIMFNEIETNQSEGIHFNPLEVIGENWGVVCENNINGVLENTETLIVNDTNFYDYFDENGYLNYEFKPNSKSIIFFTFLSNKNLFFTEKIKLTSNKMSNLLYNVTIRLSADASGSSIENFKFYNIDKTSIILDNVDEVMIRNNQFTMLSNDVFDVSTIQIIGGENGTIINNDIFIDSNSYYSYGILVSNPSNLIIKKFSKNLKIYKNNILIKSTGVAEGIYADSLIESTIKNNNINIISNGSAYGIAICNVIGRPNNITIDSNLIVVNSKDMSYLIELFMTDNCEIIDNYLMGTSNGIYGIGIYNSWNTFVNRNEIIITGNSLTEGYPNDVLGKGNVAVYLDKSSQLKSFSRNIFDVINSTLLQKDLASIINNYNINSYVIHDDNYELYFDENYKLNNSFIKKDDIILFKNFTSSKIVDITISVQIKPYTHFNQFKAHLILSDEASGSKIFGFNFTNATINLNNVGNIKIFDNSFFLSKLNDFNGLNNSISYNLFEFELINSIGITFNNTLNNILSFNRIIINSTNSNFILTKNSNNTMIINNSINSTGDLIVVINSNYSNNNILFNIFNISGLTNNIVYKASNNNNDLFLNNLINAKGEIFDSIIYYCGNSTKNNVEFNKILMNSNSGKDYAIIFDTNDFSHNIIANNYLISSNGYKRGNDAVHAIYEIVCNNTPIVVYVSLNNSEGNGSFDNPYSSIHEAINNALSGAIIYILPGYYNESNITIDKNITLMAINNDGSVYIDALFNQLFNITDSGILTINALKILNGFSVEGGSLFKNFGSLLINNSIIYNSSSYYDNSNPKFSKTNIKTPNTYYSYDCEELGLGGAILNYGNLVISSSTFFDNFAHKGGVLADFGKSSIYNSLLFNNTAVHGGAIFTDSNLDFNIDNTIFLQNMAIQTLDHCSIERTSTSPAVYTYRPADSFRPGYGGAIFSNSSVFISNSLFEANIAKSGGAIAQYSFLEDVSSNNGPNYFAVNAKIDESIFNYVPNLTIVNSIFRFNEAKSTTAGNLTMVSDKRYEYYFEYNYDGGAIFGAINQLIIFDSLFEHNTAYTSGGALCVQCTDSTIEGSKFYNNTAGESGGAIESFGKFKIFNTEINENYAKLAGAVRYASYNDYGHTQNKMDMFNVTVANNVALDKGGAFVTQVSNFAITNSNIYGNRAPTGSTFYGRHSSPDGSSNIDARNNWWGSIDGPDDSVWNTVSSRFRTWLTERVTWDAVNIEGGSPEGNGGNKYSDNKEGNSYIVTDVSTGSSIRTGSTLTSNIKSYGFSRGFSFSGNWPSGNGNGVSDGGSGEGNAMSSNSKSGVGKTSIFGNIENVNSLSKVNSSHVDDLSSVGMMDNAADSSPSSDISSAGGESGGNDVNVYEINKKIDDIEDLSLLNLLFIIIWLFFFIGFYLRYKNNNYE